MDFGPDGLQFSEAVTIRIPYSQDLLDAAGTTDPSDFSVWTYNTNDSSDSSDTSSSDSDGGGCFIGTSLGSGGLAGCVWSMMAMLLWVGSVWRNRE